MRFREWRGVHSIIIPASLYPPRHISAFLGEHQRALELHFPFDGTPANLRVNIGEQFACKNSNYCCIMGVNFAVLVVGARSE